MRAEPAQMEPAKLNSLVFTHGHIDHVGGASAFLSDTPEVRVVATKTCRPDSSAIDSPTATIT